MPCQYRDYCFSTAGEAANAAVAFEPPTALINGSTPLVTYFNSFGTTSACTVQFIYRNGTTNVTVPRPFPTCSSVGKQYDFNISQLDPSSIASGFASGAAIIFPAFGIAYLAAFVLKTIKEH